MNLEKIKEELTAAKDKDNIQYLNKLKPVKSPKQIQKTLLILIGVIVLVLGIVFFSVLASPKQRAGFKDIKVETYKSRGQTDDQKELRNEFGLKDPVQVRIIFDTKEEEKTIQFNIYDKDDQDKTIFKKQLNIQIKGSGERYVTLPSRDRTAGEYIIVVSSEGKTLLKQNIKFIE